MSRKTETRQILAAPHKVVGMDMSTFSYMLQTGRYMNDARIVVAMNSRTIGDATHAVYEYGQMDSRMVTRESVAALKKAGWITPTAIKRARLIKKYAETKSRIMGQLWLPSFFTKPLYAIATEQKEVN